MSRRSALDWAVILGIVVLLGWRASSQLAGLAGVEAEAPAPAVTLESLEGETWPLAELKGRVVVVTFWATWCRECKSEMRILQTLQATYEAKDLSVFALSVGNETETVIRSFANEHGIDFGIGHATGSLQAAFGGIPGIPTTFVIDRSGTIRHRFYGPLSTMALQTVVDRLIDRSS